MKKQIIEKTRYQGKEFTTTLQAPDESTLNDMIREMGDYAKQFNMGEVKVLESGKDPDGGYRAVVVAHNWNPFKWIKNKIELGKAKNYAEKVQIKAMQKEREEKERKEKEEKQAKRRAEKLEKLKFKADQAKLKREINPPEPKASKAVKVANAPKQRPAKSAQSRTSKPGPGIGKDIGNVISGLAADARKINIPKSDVTPEQQRREFVRNSEAAVAYRIEDNGDTAYKVLVVNNNAVRPVILKEYPPDGVTVKDNAQEAYASVNRYTGSGAPRVTNPLPRISKGMPRISRPMPRISQSWKRLR